LAFRSGDDETAVVLYEELLSLPKEDRPSHYASPENVQQGVYQKVRDAFEENLLRSKARLGRIDEVLIRIAEAKAELPPLMVEGNDKPRVYWLLEQRKRLRSIHLEVVRYLMNHGRLAEASNMLAEIAEEHPADTSIRVVDEDSGKASTWRIGPTVRRMWHEFEIVEWDVADRIAAAQ
jgi:hypothetical protein